MLCGWLLKSELVKAATKICGAITLECGKSGRPRWSGDVWELAGQRKLCTRWMFGKKKKISGRRMSKNIRLESKKVIYIYV